MVLRFPRPLPVPLAFALTLAAAAALDLLGGSCVNAVDDGADLDDPAVGGNGGDDAEDSDALTASFDVAGARDLLLHVVLPNLTASTAFTRDEGDNRARMSLVKRSIQGAADALALDVPQRRKAAGLLSAFAIPLLETAPGYVFVKRSNPNQFAATKAGIARKGLDDAFRKLTGFPSPSQAAWPTFEADDGGARRALVDTAVPQLVASTGFTMTKGDNTKRMSLTRRSLQMAADALSTLSAADPARARVMLDFAVTVLEQSPGYQTVVTGNPTNFSATKMGKARAAMELARTKCVKTPAIFLRPGVFIVDGAAWSPANKGAILAANHYGWVAIKIHHGPALEDSDAYLNDGSLVAGYHARGIQVGGWGYLTTDPEGDARTAAAQIAKHHLDFYIADVEAEYKYTSPSGAADPEAYGRSQRFVAAFRELLPHFPAAISTYGDRSDAEHLVDIDYTPWRTHGFDLMQQTYWNDFEFFRPSRCVRAAVNDGWPIGRVHPTVGLWGGGANRLVAPSEYLDDMRAVNVYGYSSFIGEAMSDDDIRGLGAGQAQGLAR